MTLLKRLSAVLALALLCAPLARAAEQPSPEAAARDLSKKEAQLKDVADMLQQISDDEFIEVFRSTGRRPANTRIRYLASRSDALEAVFGSLAALHYDQALKAGPAPESRKEIQAGLSTRMKDAEAVAVNPDTLQESGWWSELTSSDRVATYRPGQPAAVAAVRGGRKLANAADRKAIKVQQSIIDLDKQLKGSTEARQQAALHYESAKLYDGLADYARLEGHASAKAAGVAKTQPQASAEAAIKRLEAAAEKIRQGGSLVKVGEGGKAEPISTEAALKGVYENLAAIAYRQSITVGLPTEKSALAQAALDKLKITAEEDAKLVAINGKELIESGCPSSHPFPSSCDYYGHCLCMNSQGGTTQTGRKLRTPLDDRLAQLQSSLAEVSRNVGVPGQSHYQAARIYEQMAAAVSETPKAVRPNNAEAPTPKAAPARAGELSARQIYQSAGPSVVLLLCSTKEGSGELGTGSVIDEEGRILTNAHVVIRAATGQPYETIHVYFKPAKITGDPKRDLVRPYTGKVVRFDRALDLALVELEDKPASVKVLPLGDASAVEAGESVVAIGHPEQGGLWTLTQGVVSTVIANLGGVQGKDVFQTDASINRGNSGGPLIDRSGALIGVNTSMARKAADGLTITSVNFSIKSSVAKDWLASAGVRTQVVAAPEAAETETVPETVVAEAPVAPATPARPAQPVKAQILTPIKPFSAQDLIDQAIGEMEDLEKEMQEEIERRR